MRDFLIIGVVALCSIAIGAAFYFFGPSSFRGDVQGAVVGSTGTTTVPFTVLQQGEDAIGVDQQVNYRITSSEQFTSLLPLIATAQYGSNKIPQVDFSKYEVLAVFDGSHSTAGYDIKITAVQDSGGIRDVLVTHTAPGESCSVSPVQTSPYEIIEVPKTLLTMAHEDTETVSACQ